MNTESAVLSSNDDGSRLTFVIPLILLISALLVILLYLFYYSLGDHFAERTALIVQGNALNVSAGQGGAVDDSLEILQVSSQGVAFAGITGITLSADTYSLLEWSVDGFQTGVDIHFIWATQANPANMQKILLKPGNGNNLLDLNEEQSWRGTIAGMGIMVSGRLSNPVVVHRLELQQSNKPGPLALLKRFWNDWTFLEPWSQRSINFIEGMPRKALLTPVPAIALWVGVCFVIYFGLFVTRRVPLTGLPFTLFVLAGWLMLDARWQWNLWHQLESTKIQFSDKTPEEKRLAGEDGGLFQFILDIKKRLPTEPTRLFVISADPNGDTRYLRSRARFHLLPHNVFSLLSALPEHARPGDYLLIFPPLQDLQYDRGNQLLNDKRTSIPAEFVHQTSSGALFRVPEQQP